MKDPLTLLAIVSAIPGAYLSFKRSFLRDLVDQMIGPNNPGGVGTNAISLPYRLLAYVFIGSQDRWMDLFDPSSNTATELLNSDKTSGFRIFVWFFLVFIFSFLSWLTH